MQDNYQNEKPQEEESPYRKPPLFIQIFLYAYGFLWINMFFITGLNSIRLGYVDYDSGSILVAMSIGLYFIFKYLPRLF